jgi:TPR repeat
MKISVVRKETLRTLALFAIVGTTQSCAPRLPYRMPQPPPSPSSSVRVPPPSPPPIQESARKPLPQESKIKEQELKSRTPPPATTELPTQPPGTPEPSAPPLADDSSLLAKITPGTTPQRAASLRLTEEGRKLLDAGDAAKALTRLEKTIVIDSTNPYGYFYLGKAHYQLGRYKESLRFLEVAESRLSGEPFWLAEVHALCGENFRALGMVDKAEFSYAQALRLNSGNRTASDALPRLQGQSQIPSPR